jgi:phage shock protein A
MGRIMTLIRGFLSLFISGLERRNPEAILEAEKENLREQISKYNAGLASHAGLCERLITQVKRLEIDEDGLKSKTTANLKAGNRDAASQYALQLQGVSKELVENREQLKQAEETYKNLLKARDVTVKNARDKIESVRRDLSDMKMKQATADLTEMANGMISQIGGSGDMLNRLSEMVSEDKEKAAGRLRLAKDSMDMSGVELKASEQQALADQALADFAANAGIPLESSKVTESQSQDRRVGDKKMGGAEKASA